MAGINLLREIFDQCTVAKIFGPHCQRDVDRNFSCVGAFDQRRHEGLNLFAPGMIAITKQFLELIDEEEKIPAFSQIAISAPFDNGPRASREKDRKSTRLNSSHLGISYAVFC